MLIQSTSSKIDARKFVHRFDAPPSLDAEKIVEDSWLYNRGIGTDMFDLTRGGRWDVGNQDRCYIGDTSDVAKHYTYSKPVRATFSTHLATGSRSLTKEEEQAYIHEGGTGYAWAGFNAAALGGVSTLVGTMGGSLGLAARIGIASGVAIGLAYAGIRLQKVADKKTSQRRLQGVDEMRVPIERNIRVDGTISSDKNRVYFTPDGKESPVRLHPLTICGGSE